jgi:hypothetical protein
MDKSYAKKRFKLVFREFQRMMPEIEKTLALPSRKSLRGLNMPLTKLRELQEAGQEVMVNFKNNLPQAQAIYQALGPVLENKRQFIAAIYGDRIIDYVQMAERARPGDGLKVQALLGRLSPTQIKQFFQSSYFIPIGAFGSEELESYNAAFGESPLVSRLQDYVADAETLTDDLDELDPTQIEDRIIFAKMFGQQFAQTPGQANSYQNFINNLNKVKKP